MEGQDAGRASGGTGTVQADTAALPNVRPQALIDTGTTGHVIDPNGVNHPRHYNTHPSGIECIDVIEHMTPNVAFVIKHLWRAGLKPGEATLKDFDKALWYLNRERSRLAKMGVK